MSLASSTCLSYLRARDPSLVSGSGVVPVNQLNFDTLNEPQQQEETDKVLKVFLRIKRGDLEVYDIEENVLVCNVPEESQTAKNLKSSDVLAYTFPFTRIFGPKVVQLDVFNSAIKPKIVEFFNGRNFTIMTYGPSGSGKTFTVVGTDQEPGILPRSLQYIFSTVKNLASRPACKPLPNDEVVPLNIAEFEYENAIKSAILSATNIDLELHKETYKKMEHRLSLDLGCNLQYSSKVSLSIWVSFVEIYNEHLYDLLKPLPKHNIRPILKLGKSKKNHVYVKELSSIHVKNGLEAYQVLQYGLRNLTYATTAVNSHSSRSHSIFMIKLVQTPRNAGGETLINTLCFCDLAGSERMRNTNNVGARLQESKNINKSLLVLSRCIKLIKQCQDNKDTRQVIPFRDSKLTQLFQRGLSGEENVAMIVNLNPSRAMFDESIHSLDLSTFAKDIRMKELQPPDVIVDDEDDDAENEPNERRRGRKSDQEEIERLRSYVVELYDELQKVKIDNERISYEERMHVANRWQEAMEKQRANYERRRQELIERHRRELEEAKNVITLDDTPPEQDSSDTTASALKEINEELEKRIVDMKEEERKLLDRLRSKDEELAAMVTAKRAQDKTVQWLEADVQRLRSENEELKRSVQRERRKTAISDSQLTEERNKRKSLLLMKPLYADVIGENDSEPESDDVEVD